MRFSVYGLLLSGSGAVGINAQLALTEVGDGLSSGATAVVAGNVSKVEAADTVAGASAIALAASLNGVEGSDTLIGTVGGESLASLSVTEANDVLTGVSVAAVSTSVILTESSDILSGGVGADGSISLAVFEASDIIVSAIGVDVRAGAQLGIVDALDAGVEILGTGTFAVLAVVEDGDALIDAVVNRVKYRSMTCAFDSTQYNMVLLGPSEVEYCTPYAGTIAVDGKRYGLVPTRIGKN